MPCSLYPALSCTSTVHVLILLHLGRKEGGDHPQNSIKRLLFQGGGGLVLGLSPKSDKTEGVPVVGESARSPSAHCRGALEQSTNPPIPASTHMCTRDKVVKSRHSVSCLFSDLSQVLVPSIGPGIHESSHTFGLLLHSHFTSSKVGFRQRTLTFDLLPRYG